MDARKALGAWRGAEGAIEIMLPILATGAAWVSAYSLLGQPSPGRGATYIEVCAILCGCVVVTAWMASRQLYMAGKRKPWSVVIGAWIYSGVLLATFPGLVGSAFRSRCEDLGGSVLFGAPLLGKGGFALLEQGPLLCRIGGVEDNTYLPGILLRPGWSGGLDPFLIVMAVVVAVPAALAFRDVRLRPTRMAANLFTKLRYATSRGSKTFVGPKFDGGTIQACAGATMWGEVCGQIYSSSKVFQAGEWCPRCRQPFVPATRQLTFKVVTLFTADIEVLNSIERTDTVSWGRGEPMPPDARISGMERWVTLGSVTIPDVVSVAQLLALVHEMLPNWKGEDPRTQFAADLAARRASRIAGWIWFGALARRLTYARPSRDVLMALGSTRLRDLVTEGGEEMWLQLDIGLIALELRTGFRKRLDDGTVIAENSKTDLWVPVSPLGSTKDARGVWVPRIEGDALRLWMSTDRLRGVDVEGVSQPVPYERFAGQEPEALPPAELPAGGSLDFTRYKLVKEGAEPADETGPGTSVADWEWFEPEQIELLRQECLVLVERG